MKTFNELNLFLQEKGNRVTWSLSYIKYYYPKIPLVVYHFCRIQNKKLASMKQELLITL